MNTKMNENQLTIDQLTIDQSVIPRLANEFLNFLDKSETRTFEDGVSLGYNFAMKMCVNEIERLRSELQKCESFVGGFYTPPVSNIIPKSFGTPYMMTPLSL